MEVSCTSFSFSLESVWVCFPVFQIFLHGIGALRRAFVVCATILDSFPGLYPGVSITAEGRFISDFRSDSEGH